MKRECPSLFAALLVSLLVNVLLLFIGAKMLIHEWVEIDAVTSLCIILAVLVASIGASLLPQRKKA